MTEQDSESNLSTDNRECAGIGDRVVRILRENENCVLKITDSEGRSFQAGINIIQMDEKTERKPWDDGKMWANLLIDTNEFEKVPGFFQPELSVTERNDEWSDPTVYYPFEDGEETAQITNVEVVK